MAGSLRESEAEGSTNMQMQPRVATLFFQVLQMQSFNSLRVNKNENATTSEVHDDADAILTMQM
jgi:hypothetical protein